MISASDIKDHMEVRCADGQHIGTVDYLEGSENIKLTKSDSPDGEHHHLSPGVGRPRRRTGSSFNECIRRALPVDASAELNNRAGLRLIGRGLSAWSRVSAATFFPGQHRSKSTAEASERSVLPISQSRCWSRTSSSLHGESTQVSRFCDLYRESVPGGTLSELDPTKIEGQYRVATRSSSSSRCLPPSAALAEEMKAPINSDRAPTSAVVAAAFRVLSKAS